VTGNDSRPPSRARTRGCWRRSIQWVPQTGQCRDPGSTIADFERLVIDEPATEECNLEGPNKRPTVTFEELTYSNMLTLNALVELLTEKGVLS